MKRNRQLRCLRAPTLDEWAAMERLTATTPEQELVARSDAAVLRQAFVHLTAREERVIRLRFGIDCEPRTLDQVGEVLGTTRERPRQLESKALGKLAKVLLTKFRERPGAQRMRRERDEEHRRHAAMIADMKIMAETKIVQERQKIMAEAEHLRKKRIEWDILREAKGIQATIERVHKPPQWTPRHSGQYFDMPKEMRSHYAEILRALLSPHYQMRVR